MQIEQFCHSHAIYIAAQVCARSVTLLLLVFVLFFAAAGECWCVIFLVSLSLSGLLASLCAATSNLGSRSSHLSLIVHPEL